MSDQENDKDSDEMRELKRKRGTVKGRLTFFQNYVTTLTALKKKLNKKQSIELTLRKDHAVSLFSNFNDIQSQIEQLTTDSDLSSQLEIRQKFEDTYYAVISDADFLLGKEITSSKTKAEEKETSSLIKLPTISLPTFDGTYDNWLEFRDTFQSMIHKSEKLDNIQKFHYLRSALTGNALQVIKSIEFSADSYETAWDLLENRYNNTKLLVHNHVKSLFSMHSISKETPSHLRKLIDSVLKNLRALKSLGQPTDSWDTLIIYIILTKLDPVTEKEWEQFKINSSHSNNCQDLQDLIDFLKDRADMLEMIKANTSTSSSSKVSNEIPKKQSQKVHSFVAAKKSKEAIRTKPCHMCSGNHSLYTCSAFLGLNDKDKLEFIDKKQLCKNCLRFGHTADTCYFGPCRQCNLKHNSILHNECSKSSASTSVSLPSPNSSTDTNTSTVMHTLTRDSQIQTNEVTSFISAHRLGTSLLSTALVDVLGSDNNYFRARVLLDSGSEHCLITNSFCNKINASSIQSTCKIAGVGNSITESKRTCEIQLKSLYGNYHIDKIVCLILPEITSNYPAEIKNLSALSIPENIQLADPTFNNPSEVDILIGVYYFWDLFLKGSIRLSSGTYLKETVLGWIVAGPLDNHIPENKRITQTQCNFVQSKSIDERFKKFWEIEELPNNPKQCLTLEDRACEDLFVSTHKRTDEGRFSVQMPLKESPESLGDSYNIAYQRFLSLERRLDQTPLHKEMYNEFMQEYIHLGHMTRIESYNTPYYILPHHGIFRETNLTTKCRSVFNASQPSSNGKSLNDIQMTGPPLQNDIFSILLRFRQYRYVACSDIEKFFRQILIQEKFRNLQLILWREKSSEPVSVYQLNTVTYGTASAPYLSIRCVQQLAFECDDEEVKQALLNDFYVDDFITGHDCKDKLSELCRKVTDVCNSGCFPLRKWIFNSPDIALNVVKENDQIKHLSLGENCSSKTLGLGWNNKHDELHFITKLKSEHSPARVTKREILSIVSQVYDPLGLLSPAVISAKILLQKLWLCKAGWDDPLPNDIVKKWETFLNSLSNLPNIRIPRHVIGTSPKQIELHLFTDSSEVAYGSCAYIRTVSFDGHIVVNLLCAKTRVAPLKSVSIPRLELCGVQMGARLIEKITKALRVNFSKIVVWTDSTIVLSWIKMSPHLLKTFVQNRVVEINELAGNAIFLHIDGKQNPADILSRGLNLNDLSECDTWWHGPSLLRDTDFTTSSYLYNKEVDLPELKSKSTENTSLLTTTSQSDKSNSESGIDFGKFSSFKRLQRVYGYIMRFIHNARAKKQGNKRLSGCLSVKELSSALLSLTRIVQKQSFPIEYNCLLNKLPLKSSRSVSSLNIFMDENLIIRVGGRILYGSNFNYNKKHPVLLCGKHYFTQLLFQQEHLNLLHAGPQLLLAHIRETWWPLNGRNLAKKTVRQCVTCTRMSGKTIQPIMAPLPSQRLESGYCFEYCGVDNFGPMFYLNKRGRGSKLMKCYACLFVCFSTRALHLELVTSMSSESYILALKRFVSRRGKPKEIHSDQGRNFVGAAREFEEFLHNHKDSIINYASENKINFIFNPPGAPHFGGLWERGVQSCKHHIKRVVGNSNLTYEEFSTVLVQIEAVLNSRPLCPLSADPNDFTPLTPGHFLVGRPLTAPASDDITSKPILSLSRFQRVEQMRQHFWKRWSKEYVAELQKRVKWKTNHDDIKPNTMVLIKEDNLPPLKWRLGRILSVFPGQDGVARVANIRTASGIIQRAFSKICPLPVRMESSTDEQLDSSEPVESRASQGGGRC